MSMVEPIRPPAVSAEEGGSPPLTAKPDYQAMLRKWGARLEQLLDFLGDKLNPILVKEARQSMKSKQFSVTFSLLLLLSWIWTAIFVSFSVPDVFYEAWGIRLLIGYVIILSVPLFIVVPFAAFRSLAAETEDGTFELLSITSLSARQIVIGKLGSSILQMMVYYSALAPSIAFTYLLKGVDIASIGLLLLHSFVISVCLSILGLLAATVTRARHWQVLVSVVLVAALLIATIILDSIFIGMTQENVPFDSPGFWVANLALLNLALAFGALFLVIAAGQITFASENRSTPVRMMLLLMQCMWIGWLMFLWRWVDDRMSEPFLWIMVFIAAIFWMVAGALMTGETAQLSPRAKRNLPQSLLGRILLTWFNPGSGSGYVFAVVNLLAIIAVQGFACVYALATNDRAPSDPGLFFASLAIFGYVAGYLGVVRLFTSVARKFAPLNMLSVFLLQFLAVVMGAVVPFLLLTIQTIGDPAAWYYTELQIPNWFWTIWELTWPTTRVTISPVIPLSIFALGSVVFLANLLHAALEVEQVRTLAPSRVLQDDAGQRAASPKRKKNPWDEE